MLESSNPDAVLAELLAEVRRVEVHGRRLARGALAGAYRTVFRGAGIELDTVREYEPGDEPRRIDWNVTARMGRPFVRTTIDERDLSVVFVLDVSPSMDGGWGAYTARDTAARVVACLAINAVRAGDRVGMIAFGSGVESFVPARRGPGHALRIVRDALVLRGTSGAGGLDAALDRIRDTTKRDAVALVISDFHDGGSVAAWGAAARRHDVIAVRLVPPETDAARTGLVRVVDPEGGAPRIIDLAHRPLRRAWETRRAAWQTDVERRLAEAGIDRLDVRIPRERDRDHVARALLAFFRMREVRGMKR